MNLLLIALAGNSYDEDEEEAEAEAESEATEGADKAAVEQRVKKRKTVKGGYRVSAARHAQAKEGADQGLI